MIQRVTTQADYLLREAFTGLMRSGWMLWAAVSTLSALLFLLGLGLEVSWQMESALTKLGSQMEISVYLEPRARARQLEPRLNELVGVEQVQSTTREAAWASLQKELGVQGDATASLGGNPLVDSLRVRVRDPHQVVALAGQIKALPGVERVHFGSEAAERLGRVQEALRWVGIALTAILSTATVAVITNTIRLIVLSRSKEIEVMQLVGATPLRIVTPFIVEGLAFGVVGALCAWGLLKVLGHLVEQKRQELLPFLEWQQTGSETELPAILFGVGISLGVLSSLLAVRRTIR